MDRMTCIAWLYGHTVTVTSHANNTKRYRNFSLRILVLLARDGPCYTSCCRWKGVAASRGCCCISKTITANTTIQACVKCGLFQFGYAVCRQEWMNHNQTEGTEYSASPTFWIVTCYGGTKQNGSNVEVKSSFYAFVIYLFFKLWYICLLPWKSCLDFRLIK